MPPPRARARIAPGSTFESRPKLISLGDRFWSVHNYDDVYLGSVTLETATVHSDNAVYADLTQLVGPRARSRRPRDAGIKSRLNPYFAIGLGAESVNPLDARAFSVFPMNGYRIDSKIFGNNPRFVSELGLQLQAHDEGRHQPRRPRCDGRRRRRSTTSSRRSSSAERSTGCAARPAGRREDGDDRELRRRVVRRLHAAARRGGVGGRSDELKPMETEFHGDPVAGGTYPR